MTRSWLTGSGQETEAVGEAIAEALLPLVPRDSALILRLDGEMGVGKTTLTGGICRALGIRRVKSPTYTVVNEYRGTVDVFHFDFYRLADEDDLASVGYEDYLARRALVIVEWADAVPGSVPRTVPTVALRRTDDGDGREITLTIHDEKGGI